MTSPETPIDATDAAESITVFWRPGCPFCMSLERSLGKLGIDYERRNIWEDPDAAAQVRAVANGNETVPTVIVGSQFMVNPSGREVLELMRQEMPDSVPPETESRSNPIETTIRRILGG